MLTSLELSRFESLGNDCEIGFVLRHLGSDEGSYFRWIAIETEQVMSLIEKDFEGAYEFSNLVPHTDRMVRDVACGGAYHSKMVSKDYPTGRRFIAPDNALRQVHASEVDKIRHLRAKFAERMSLPGVIYVLKRGEGVSDEDLRALNDLLLAKRDGCPYMLLHIRPVGDAPELGTVRHLHDNVVEGYVSRIAHWESTDDADYESWTSVFEAAASIDMENIWPDHVCLAAA